MEARTRLGEVVVSRGRSTLAVVLAVVLALAFLAGRYAGGDSRTQLHVGREYAIDVPAGGQHSATYLGACPGVACPEGGPVGRLPYHLFQVGDSRVALYLVDWISPAG